MLRFFPADIFNTYAGEGQGLRLGYALKNTYLNFVLHFRCRLIIFLDRM